MPAGGAGFEPTPPGSKPGVLPLDDPPVIAGEPGFEPGIAGPEPAVLPLHHSPILGENERAPDSLTGSASRAQHRGRSPARSLWLSQDLNLEREALQASALPIELLSHGERDGIRTHDLQRDRLARTPLLYAPASEIKL